MMPFSHFFSMTVLVMMVFSTAAGDDGPQFVVRKHTAFVAANTANAAMVHNFLVTSSTASTLAFSSTTASMTVGSTTGLVQTDNSLTTGGTYSLTATDGTLSTTKTVTYYVFTDSNDPAITGAGTGDVKKNAPKGTTVSVDFTAADADSVNGDGLFYEIAASTEFEIGLFDGVIKTKVSPLGAGPYSLSLTVKDSKGTNAATATLTITVKTDSGSGAAMNFINFPTMALCVLAIFLSSVKHLLNL